MRSSGASTGCSSGRRRTGGDAAIADAFADAGAEVDQVSRGERGVLGELSWQVLWPPPRGVEPGNAASIVLDVRPGAACVGACLSAHAARRPRARSRRPGCSAARTSNRVDVVKVAHHGSADQSAALYEALHATVGLIGVGAGNDYGHPTDELLGILAAVGTTAAALATSTASCSSRPAAGPGEVRGLDREVRPGG